MTIRRFLLTGVMTALGVLSIPALSEAVTLHKLSSDQEMNDLMHNIAFVAEGRIGDLGGPATHELNLHESDPGKPDITAHYSWGNERTDTFILAYDAPSGWVNFSIGGETISHVYTDSFSDIFVRTRAVDAQSQIRVDNLQLDGVMLDGFSHAIAETGGLDILHIAGVTTSFLLFGQATMSWLSEAPPPTQARLAFQIKVSEGNDSDTPPQGVPEPSAIASFVLLGLGGILSRRQ
ncbi:PEP-CTERM sorting domain-containing protein [Spirulina subsalsa FACHB-351]|uniref:PEP-CTERM sorting domain-containing protein n=1 Tax=Spirulina subsalsa FACHB-351 TaxID=234711 RepID=A0ABT3L7C4_9CYAN|nr:PEP-CTERM sorting domain-containing protein [Spirulina subsalsa]MCW6037423.1 PEP-CTERM sorting domain-containing protein [Spirulina subsalsa FACHB-351]